MNPACQQLRVVVCGHIDHGKSTLIGRLLLDTKSLADDKLKELKQIAKTFGQETQLAHLSDQLKEERERNITIETTQIFFKTRKRPYCLIDTPGHLEFIRNMLTGTSQAQAALLLIDIKEGIADQTRRHAYLLKLLAIPNIIVLVNKMDLVDYSQKHFNEIKNALNILFSELNIVPLHIIPLSAKNSENISRASKKMAWFRGPCLINALDALITPEDVQDKAHLRLAVQDIYTQNNEKILVGTIASGKLKQGQKICILPHNAETRVKEIKIFNKRKNSAIAGESIGLLLTDDCSISRGDIVSGIKTPAAKAKTFTGNIFWLSPKELLPGQNVTLQCSTQKFDCQVTKIIEAVDPTDLKIMANHAKCLQQNQAGVIGFTLLTGAVVEEYSEIPQLGRYTIENADELCGAGTVLSVVRE